MLDKQRAKQQQSMVRLGITIQDDDGYDELIPPLYFGTVNQATVIGRALVAICEVNHEGHEGIHFNFTTAHIDVNSLPAISSAVDVLLDYRHYTLGHEDPGTEGHEGTSDDDKQPDPPSQTAGSPMDHIVDENEFCVCGHDPENCEVHIACKVCGSLDPCEQGDDTRIPAGTEGHEGTSNDDKQPDPPRAQTASEGHKGTEDLPIGYFSSVQAILDHKHGKGPLHDKQPARDEIQYEDPESCDDCKGKGPYCNTCGCGNCGDRSYTYTEDPESCDHCKGKGPYCNTCGCGNCGQR